MDQTFYAARMRLAAQTKDKDPCQGRGPARRVFRKGCELQKRLDAVALGPTIGRGDSCPKPCLDTMPALNSAKDLRRTYVAGAVGLLLRNWLSIIGHPRNRAPPSCRHERLLCLQEMIFQDADRLIDIVGSTRIQERIMLSLRALFARCAETQAPMKRPTCP